MILEFMKKEMKTHKEFNRAMQGVLFGGICLVIGVIILYFKYVIIGLISITLIYVTVKFYKPIKSFILNMYKSYKENKNNTNFDTYK